MRCKGKAEMRTADAGAGAGRARWRLEKKRQPIEFKSRRFGAEKYCVAQIGEW
jgi:hypothetical protein